MDILIKAAAICVPAAIFTASIKKDSPAMSLTLAIAACTVTLYLAIGALSDVSGFISELADKAGISQPVVSALIKTVGIAIVSKFASDICREAGLLGAASATELAGTVSSIYVALPVMRTTFQMLSEIL